MFSSISSFISSAGEAAGQFPGDRGGVALLEQPVAECQLVKIGPAPSLLTMAGISVPNEVLQLILKNLSPEQLVKVCRVCKVFNEVASGNSLWNSYPLREVFPNATFITKGDWEAYIDVSKLVVEQKGRPCVDKSDYKELKRMESQVEDGMGITIMTLLQRDKVSNIEESAANPKAGNPVTFKHFSNYITNKLGDVEAEAVTVAMTNNVFIGSRKRSVAERKQIAKDLKCKVPGILAATRLGVMRFCMSPQGALVRLFNDNPPTWTLCIDEKIDETTGEIVEVISHFGGFALAGPSVYALGVGKESRGVAGLREFKAIGP